MNKAFLDVREFEDRMIAESPIARGFVADVKLRRSLIFEEYHETMSALDNLCGCVGDGGIPVEDLAGVADGLADLIWVCIGTALALGIDLPRVWEEVRRANMDKFADGHTFRADGKLLKPPGWSPPNIVAAIEGRDA